MLHNRLLSVTLLLTLALLSSALPARNKAVLIGLRIEGSDTTIFEGRVLTRGHNLMTASGESHHCDGTNNNAHPHPVPTFTSALDDAAMKNGFNYNAEYYPSLDDFFVTSIDEEIESNKQYWGQYLNFRENQIGGCQLQVKSGDYVLFAAFVNMVSDEPHLLKLTGPHLAHLRQPVVLTVTDGRDGSVVAGADVNGQKTNAEGQVSVTFIETGRVGLKAQKSGSVRSNQLDILVIESA